MKSRNYFLFERSPRSICIGWSFLLVVTLSSAMLGLSVTGCDYGNEESESSVINGQPVTEASVLETADEYGTVDGSLTASFSGSYAAKYAWAWKNNPNSNFGDWTNYDGDCTNFANQAILAGLAKSFDKATVYSARKTYQDKIDLNNAWYYNTKTDLAQPQWKGADGLYIYLQTQAAHPTWTGMKVTYVAKNTTKTAAAKVMKLGDIVSWTNWNTAKSRYVAYHSTVVSAQASDYNYHELSYRSGICDPPCPPASKLIKNISVSSGTKFNVFRITGFSY